MQRILLLTASFGEGHNSAAKNLAAALSDAGAQAEVIDPCSLAAPRTANFLSQSYRQITTHTPWLWARLYKRTDRIDFATSYFPFRRQVIRKLAEIIQLFQPQAIVSTYPLYPYLVNQIEAKGRQKTVKITLITDSININSAWTRAATDYWFLSDDFTRESMLSSGFPAEKLITTGFPVPTLLSQPSPIHSAEAPSPFRVLYFPTSKLPHIRRFSKAILDASPDTHLTLVLGRNFRLLYSRAREINDLYPGRVHVYGWTRKVPQLLVKHHLILGKAGGATVHEALAARCPMLINHLVPGQEEGNLALLQKLNAGTLTLTPDAVENAIVHLLENNAQAWREQKDSLQNHQYTQGAQTAAAFILERLQS